MPAEAPTCPPPAIPRDRFCRYAELTDLLHQLVRAVGLPALVADDERDFVERAVRLAGDPGERSRLRAHLAGPGRASALFDTAATTRALESAYRTMAAQFRTGHRAPFRVDATGAIHAGDGRVPPDDRAISTES